MSNSYLRDLFYKLIDKAEQYKNRVYIAQGEWIAFLEGARSLTVDNHSEPIPVWTEGICGDGAAILKDGVMVPIEEVIRELNYISIKKSLQIEDEYWEDVFDSQEIMEKEDHE